MQRNQNESFEAYKIRRSDANKAVKMLNYAVTHGGAVSSRVKHRAEASKLGGFGELLRNHFKVAINPKKRRANEKAFAKRIANSYATLSGPTARQKRVARRAAERASK